MWSKSALKSVTLVFSHFILVKYNPCYIHQRMKALNILNLLQKISQLACFPRKTFSDLTTDSQSVVTGLNNRICYHGGHLIMKNDI